MVLFSYTSAFVYTLPFIANRRLIKDEIKYGPIEKGFVQWYERKGISDANYMESKGSYFSDFPPM